MIPLNNFLVCVFIVHCSLCLGIEVNISDGTILGTTHKTPNGLDFYAFRQVPFAAPPLGSLRFEAPAPVVKWEGILNTTANTKTCYQKDSQSSTENEDCLYLNVYTPVQPISDAKLAVFVYVHGGAFIVGNSVFETTGPDFFMDYNVIVVTVQYRLGVFGFLSTQDDVIPGNNGLKDVLAALEWVQKNIAVFGGDPKKVTLGGQSAGAAMVGFHVISEKSSGLFRSAILESGSALCSWAYQRYSKKYAYNLASSLDNTITSDNTTQELLTVLRSVSPTELNTAKFEEPSGLQLGQGDVFAPVIEVDHKGAFISDRMHTRLEKGQFNQVPVLMGVNSEELIHLADNINNFKAEMTKYDEKIESIVNEDYNVDKENLTEAANMIRKIYTNTTFHDNLGGAIKFRSDVRYTTAVSAQAALQSKYSNVYFYVFGFHGFLAGNTSVEGADNVGHSDELIYLWRNNYNSDLSKYPEKDITTHNRMLTMWTNFIKNLNPTSKQSELLQNVTWPLVTPEKFQFLNINEDLEVKENPKKYKEWKSVIDQFGNPPYDTY